MPRGVYPGLSPLSYLPATDLLLCFGHHLHVVCLDHSVLTEHSLNVKQSYDSPAALFLKF